MSLTWSRLLLIVQFSAFTLNAKLTDRRVLGSLRRKNYSDLIDAKSGNVASVDSRGFKSILRVWKSCVCLSVKFTFSSSKQNVLTKHDWAKYSWSLNLSRLPLGNLHSPGPTKLTPGNIYHFHLRRRFKFLAAHERELLFSMSRFEKKKTRLDVAFDRSQLKAKLGKWNAMMIEKTNQRAIMSIVLMIITSSMLNLDYDKSTEKSYKAIASVISHTEWRVGWFQFLLKASVFGLESLAR